MLLGLPLLLISVILYNLLAFRQELLASVPESAAAQLPAAASAAGDGFGAVLWSMQMESGVVWAFTMHDFMLILTLALLAAEMVRATAAGVGSAWNHAWSTVLFIGCLAEFLLVGKAVTSLFFFITAAAFIDVAASFGIAIRSAQGNAKSESPVRRRAAAAAR